ncbi:MAG TPA: type IV pilus modification protein PilV [Rugosibacter sp.]
MIHNSMRTTQAGFSLLEVLITMAVLAVGLLGLAGLQGRGINAETESFSRGQAMMLANELADRMGANLAELKTSTSASTGYNQQDGSSAKIIFGTSYANDCITVGNNTSTLQAQCCATKTSMAARDLCEWDLALKGIAESTASGGKMGGMSDARGCVFLAPNGEFEVDVVWKSRDIGVIGNGNTCGQAAIVSRRSGVSRTLRVAALGAP